MVNPKSILVLTTGGTIDKIYFDANSEFTIGDSEVLDIAAMANVQIPLRVQSVMRKDSLDMNDADRQQILEVARDASETHILITHGTDTMVKTAQVLAKLEHKTIVFTGAMQPSRMKISDAEFNIGFALGVLQTLPAGVYIAMSGQVLDPLKARKNRDIGRFEIAQ